MPQLRYNPEALLKGLVVYSQVQWKLSYRVCFTMTKFIRHKQQLNDRRNQQAVSVCRFRTEGPSLSISPLPGAKRMDYDKALARIELATFWFEARRANPLR